MMNWGPLYVVEPGTCSCIKYTSPLITSLDDSAFRLTSVADGVAFDLDADGAAEQCAWTAMGSNDAFIALDRNGNGRIDNGLELFGTATVLTDGDTASNGFEALEDLDGGASSDGVLLPGEAHFDRLLLWRDANHDGISDPDELQTVEHAGVRALYTSYEERPRRDANGNRFRYQGWLSMRYGDGHEKLRKVIDVFLKAAR